MEPMTLWQFYAVFFVMCIVGVGLCWAMFLLGARNPLLGHKRGTWAEKMRDKLMIGFLLLAGIASYATLEDIIRAFTNDVADVVATTTVDIGEKVIKGERIQNDIDLDESIRNSLSGTIWGEYDSSQKNTLYLMTGFWYFLAWCIYFGNYAKSASTWWQKLFKIIAYPCLTSVILLFPLNVHYCNRSELMPPLVFLAIAGVLILLSHDRTPLPPELPSELTPEQTSEQSL